MQYPSGILAEHHAVRTGVGDLRRLPHGRVRDHRPRPERLRQPGHLQRRRRARAGRGAVLGDPHAQGTFVDDCTVYRFEDKLMIVVNASNTRQGLGAHRRPEGRAPTSGSRTSPTRSASSRCRGREAEALLQPLADIPLERHRVLPLRRAARSPARSASSPAPATPARTASSSTAASGTPSRSGRRSPRPAPSRSGSAPAIRCGWRWATRSTATRSTTPSRRSRPGSAGS